ncbi:DUF6600 domain-containing protein [Spirosoma sp.]|uniref:DUF6600 domain-containing protein n=1 Tax=Spirosoma sp. TaxID=1899569 RepID=UPI002614FA46|nr:DUF6600 domain-containing protein [Spirosoma sp.]MCX6217718.1 hypothetical protein [Spirosoma sp.]
MTILKTIQLLGLMAVLAIDPIAPQKATAQPGISVPIQTFYNELAPYGQWIPNPVYGSVWIPNVGPDFQPYATDGHWVVTEFGNTWVSDYAWGWAPFHYGRWFFDSQYGWAWVPGNDWGPAWVSWRTGGGYYGWAPLGPGIDINVNINIPAPYWTFVPQIYITSPRLYSYRVARPNVINIYQNTTIINNVYRSNNRAYVYGPNRYEIERVTRQRVPVYRIDPLDRPGRSVVGNGSVGFYRPGQPSGYGQNYGRNDRDRYNDRYDNRRPDYNNNNTPGRDPYNGGNNVPNREYNGNNSPGRSYEGNAVTPSREYNGSPNRGGTYNGDFNNAPASPNRNRYNSTPAPGNNTPTPSAPVESGRGSYSPGNAQPQQQGGGFSRRDDQPAGLQQTQPNRTYEQRTERLNQSPGNTPSIPGARSENGGGFQRSSENRGAQPQQRIQEQSQRVNGAGERQRGPR